MKDVKSQAKNPASGAKGGLNAEIQSTPPPQLRAMYDDVVRQGVPERFAELIRKLDVPANPSHMGDTGEQTTNNDGRD